ncbi:MAG: hypothetical protein WC238_04580 [Parcubacteria group bacterium]
MAPEHEKQQGLNQILREKIRQRIGRGTESAMAAIQRLVNEGKVAQDFVAPIGVELKHKGSTAVMTFAANGKVKMNLPNGEYNIAPLAVTQLASRFGIPSAYLRDLSIGDEWHRQLAAKILNEHTGWTERERVLVRTVGEDVRGVLSDHYRRLNSQTILQAFIEMISTQGATIADGFMDDSKMWVEALIPEPIDIPTSKNGIVTITFGARIASSDYGDGALDLRAFFMQGACLNGMVTNSVMNQIHLGSRLPENLYLSEETYRKDTDTQASAVRDITQGLLSRDAIMAKIDEIQRAASIEVNPADELRQMLKAGRLSKADVNGIETLMMRNSPDDGLQGESTLWKLSQGITALAREAEPRKSREMQEIAGELLSRK